MPTDPINVEEVEVRIIDVVFDGPPGAESGRFVEVEDTNGASVRVGEWVERPDGYWALRLAVVPRGLNDAAGLAQSPMPTSSPMKIWSCKIGEIPDDLLPDAADWPMRKAVAAAYLALTGQPNDFIFSGWGGRLTEVERAVVEDRAPDRAKVCMHPKDCPGCEGARDRLTREERSYVETMRVASQQDGDPYGLAPGVAILDRLAPPPEGNDQEDRR